MEETKKREMDRNFPCVENEESGSEGGCFSFLLHRGVTHPLFYSLSSYNFF